MAALLLGCGDIGLRIATKLDQTETRYGLIRRAEQIDTLKQYGIEPILWDLDQPAPLCLPAELNDGSVRVFYSIPPDRNSLTDNRIARAIAAFKTPPANWVYLSTSGVYGDRQGNWVTETSEVSPLTDRAKRRVSAEQQLMYWHQQENTAVVILRVPGIYGPGRLPITKLKNRQPIITPEESPYTNLIHAEDLAIASICAANRGKPGQIYNVSDGHPVKTSEYYLAVANTCELAAPPMISMAEAQHRFDANRLSFLNESRRLDVSKMQQELQPTLKFENLQEGLRASLIEDQSN